MSRIPVLLTRFLIAIAVVLLIFGIIEWLVSPTLVVMAPLRHDQALYQWKVADTADASDGQVNWRYDMNYTLVDTNWREIHHDTNRTLATVPYPRITKSVNYTGLMDQQWFSQLQSFLNTCTDASPVAFVSANYAYREVLINWLISARIKVRGEPLENVLVGALDEPLHTLMLAKGIDSIYIEPDSILTEPDWVKPYSKLLIARITVLRLINLWGYDVTQFDTDAIVIKNPQPLYNVHFDSDIIGSTGLFPQELSRKWGFTLCMGMIVFRSTVKTGMSYSCYNSYYSPRMVLIFEYLDPLELLFLIRTILDPL